MPQRTATPIFFLFLFASAPIRHEPSSTLLWTAPAILLAAMMIAWAAEASQFFIAQGFALAILAWMQTLPEFAVEAVLAWKQQTPLLLANLTGALRLLTGLGWPVIYFTAAMAHRKRTGESLNVIRLHESHSVEIVGLLAALAYVTLIALKSSINALDSGLLVLIYAVYLFILAKLPAESMESIDELEQIPRAIVLSPRWRRIAMISGLFLAGAVLIKVSAEPFLGSLLAIAMSLGIPEFRFVQWIAPLVSEFPEMASTVYFARQEDRAPMALMNMVSSNINQWTILAAMLPVIYSISLGYLAPITFDGEQRLELWMTLGQALVGAMMLLKMELVWWEALALLVMFAAGIALPAAAAFMTRAYFIWAGIELARIVARRRKPEAIAKFAILWRRCF